MNSNGTHFPHLIIVAKLEGKTIGPTQPKEKNILAVDDKITQKVRYC